MIDILFVEDQPYVSEATARRIRSNPEVGEIRICATAPAAMRALEEAPDRWGLILLDLDVPGAVGLSLAMQIRDLGKAPITCILTGTFRPDYLAQAQAENFQGYILKATEIDKLEESLKRAIAGERVFESSQPTVADATVRLTRMQRLCLEVAEPGHTARDIARMINADQRSAQYHISSALAALSSENLFAARQKAISLGLIAPAQGERQ